jgi:diadenylate cyclase
MTAEEWLAFCARHWRDALEIILLAFGIYGVWVVLRATRGAKVLLSMAVTVLAVMLLSQALHLQVLAFVLRYVSIFLVTALLVIFQPELRRALIALGSHRLLSLVAQDAQGVQLLVESAFELANRQFGALIALERETSLASLAEGGVPIDAQITAELLVTIFHPKTPLHDGGVIIRSDRIVSAATIFPLTQRSDLDRNLGLRHRAGLGLTEEFDAVVLVVSEETGIVSICHHGTIERNFDPEACKRRLGELLTSEKPEDEASVRPLAREDRGPRSRRHTMGGHPEEHRDDRLAF